MDGENNGKPYEQMDDLGVPLFLETPILVYKDPFINLPFDICAIYFDLKVIPKLEIKHLESGGVGPTGGLVAS